MQQEEEKVEVVRTLRTGIAPTMKGLGLVSAADGVFRIWGARREVCGAVAVFPYSRQGHYTIEIGLVAPLVREAFGLSVPKRPRPSSANGSGMYYRLERLLGQKMETGYMASSREDVAALAAFFCEKVVEVFPTLWGRLGTLAGWAAHYQDALDRNVAGREYLWKMLGLSIVGSAAGEESEFLRALGVANDEGVSQDLLLRLEVHGRQRWPELRLPWAGR